MSSTHSTPRIRFGSLSCLSPIAVPAPYSTGTYEIGFWAAGLKRLPERLRA